jgi:IS6 family transposase
MGTLLTFSLSKTRDSKSAKRFLKKALAFSHVSTPRIITVDKNPAYPVAIEELKEEKRCHNASKFD